MYEELIKHVEKGLDDVVEEAANDDTYPATMRGFERHLRRCADGWSVEHNDPNLDIRYVSIATTALLNAMADLAKQIAILHDERPL